jgi:hypothetical protein
MPSALTLHFDGRQQEILLAPEEKETMPQATEGDIMVLLALLAVAVVVTIIIMRYHARTRK